VKPIDPDGVNEKVESHDKIQLQTLRAVGYLGHNVRISATSVELAKAVAFRCERKRTIYLKRKAGDAPVKAVPGLIHDSNGSHLSPFELRRLRWRSLRLSDGTSPAENPDAGQ
jgi:hypothetical protein